MSILLATLCLNEMEWLAKLVRQHKDWPGLTRWVFVEAADRFYAKANPEMVIADGLSVDGTTDLLRKLADEDERVTYIRYGWSGHDDAALGKCGARQAYLDIAEDVRPEFVITLDADEFYTKADQAAVVDAMRFHKDHKSFIFNRREIWRPPSIVKEPLMNLEVVGGFWGIPCCHWWRWERGMNHRRCHNTPHTIGGKPMNQVICDLRGIPGVPEMIHLGFASKKKTRLAKNSYYAARGEEVDKSRKWYVESRAAWENWQPGDVLPRGAEVRKYDGPVPEVFQ